MKKLVVLDGHHYLGGDYDDVAELCEAAKIEFKVLDCETQEDIIRCATDADAYLCNFIPIGKEVIPHLPNLKLVVRCGVGVDNLDVAALTEAGILVCNVPDYGIEEVAVHALALTLALERKITLYNRRVHEGLWDENEGYDMRRLSNQTLGLLGFGHIAQTVAQFAQRLYHNIIAYDPYLPEDRFGHTQSVDIETLFRQSDTLIVLAPATSETYHIVNRERLDKIKPGLRLINVSRGSLVDTDAIVEAINKGTIAAAALDVLEKEPPTFEVYREINRDNIILTPHAAYRSVESLQALKTKAAEAAICFLQGEKPPHIVNPEVYVDQ